MERIDALMSTTPKASPRVDCFCVLDGGIQHYRLVQNVIFICLNLYWIGYDLDSPEDRGSRPVTRRHAAQNTVMFVHIICINKMMLAAAAASMVIWAHLLKRTLFWYRCCGSKGQEFG